MDASLSKGSCCNEFIKQNVNAQKKPRKKYRGCRDRTMDNKLIFKKYLKLKVRLYMLMFKEMIVNLPNRH